MVDFLKLHRNLILMILPVIIGLAMALYDILEYQDGLASVNWTETKGKILTNSIRSERINNQMVFIPSVTYSYHIGDNALRGSRITFPEGMAASERNLRALLESVAIEHPIKAYFDPKNTSHVTLTRGVRRAKYFSLFLRDGAIVAIVPLLMLWSFLSKRLRPAKPSGQV